ncbi:hypothetical protein [Arcanobacterium phocae]|uniref:hypothetical protein n=1 Tax=Arcanobacterium phocae TaxID=131112 RepID=UPI001C0F18CE|nr:hypothetical protein [Arcanobacterium phocae]
MTNVVGDTVFKPSKGRRISVFVLVFILTVGITGFINPLLMKSNAFGVGETYRGFIKEGVDAHDIFVASEDGKFVHQAFCYDKTKEQPSVLVSKEDFEKRAFSAAKV